VQIADAGEEALEAWRWLDSVGRRARVQDGFRFGEPGPARLWRPNEYLESRLTSAPMGTALDLACGSGRDAVFLASRGFEVTAVDHLPDAVALGQDLERRYLNRTEPIQWVCTDLDEFEASGKFDMVTCFFYLNRRLLARVPDLLEPGGVFVMQTFTTLHRERFGKPRSEEFVLGPGEILDLVKGLEVVDYEESWVDDRHTARCCLKLAGHNAG